MFHKFNQDYSYSKLLFPQERLSITFYYLNSMEKPGESFDCYMVSWDEAYRLGKAIARKIKESGFDPDLVIGVARGGLVPARIVCDFLLKKDLACVKVEHWGIAATLGTAKIKYPLPVDVTGKSSLSWMMLQIPGIHLLY